MSLPESKSPAYATKTRKIVSKPTATSGVVYSIRDKERPGTIEGDIFLPTWDDTDHLHFACENCGGIADILEVSLESLRKCSKSRTLHLLGLRTVGFTGQRKIYLDRRSDSGAFQKTLVENQLLVYADERIPYSRTKLIAPMEGI
jgi:hypothetical protein